MMSEIHAPLVVLETSRLILRPMSDIDAPLIVKWRNSKHVASMSLRSREANLTVQEHLAWLSKTRGERVDYLIELKEGHQPIGSLSWVWHQLCESHLCAESGKYIGEPLALGKGYASEAAIRWVQYAFEDIGLDCLIAITRLDNAPNIRLNQNLGFMVQSWPEQLERSSDDWVFMSLKKQEWIQMRKLSKGNEHAV